MAKIVLPALCDKHQKEMRQNVEKSLDGKERGKPRCWDRGSEYGVIESAKGGGLGVREELKECWDDRV